MRVLCSLSVALAEYRRDCETFEVHLDVLEEATKTLLLGKYVQENVSTLNEELVGILAVVLEGALEVSPRLRVVAEDLVDDSTDEPELARVLLRYRLQNVIKLGECLLVVPRKNQA